VLNARGSTARPMSDLETEESLHRTWQPRV
jgi:hypothetical protein